MNVEIPKNCTEEELQQIRKTLEESIANSLGKNPKDVKITIGPETDEVITSANDVTTVAVDATTAANDATTAADDATTVAVDATTTADDGTTIAADATTVEADTTTVSSFYEISADDATLAEEIQKSVRVDDFAQNVNKSIDEKKNYLTVRLQVLKIKDVKPGDTVDDVKEIEDPIVPIKFGENNMMFQRYSRSLEGHVVNIHCLTKLKNLGFKLNKSQWEIARDIARQLKRDQKCDEEILHNIINILYPK